MRLLVICFFLCASTVSFGKKTVVHLVTLTTKLGNQNELISIPINEHTAVFQIDTLLNFLDRKAATLPSEEEQKYLLYQKENIRANYIISGNEGLGFRSWFSDFKMKKTYLNPVSFIIQLILQKKAYLLSDQEYLETVFVSRKRKKVKLIDRNGKYICKVMALT